MFLAKDSQGNLIEATKNTKGFCPVCGDELIPKCGSLIIHHWAHRNDRDCDPWAESEGPWHKSWKALFPNGNQEVSLELAEIKHRADIHLNNGLTIELQHSPISPEDIVDREEFYGKTGGMIWLLDAYDPDHDGKESWLERVELSGFCKKEFSTLSHAVVEENYIQHMNLLRQKSPTPFSNFAARERAIAKLRLLLTTEGALGLKGLYLANILRELSDKLSKLLIDYMVASGILSKRLVEFVKNSGYFSDKAIGNIARIHSTFYAARDEQWGLMCDVGQPSFFFRIVENTNTFASTFKRRADSNCAGVTNKLCGEVAALKYTKPGRKLHNFRSFFDEVELDAPYSNVFRDLRALEQRILRESGDKGALQRLNPEAKVHSVSLPGLTAFKARPLTFVWKHPRKSINTMKAPILWDVGNERFLVYYRPGKDIHYLIGRQAFIDATRALNVGR